MNKNWFKKFGFVSVELVIVASIILGVGMLGISSLGTKGSALATQTMGVLDATGVFGNVETPSATPTYDANGYDTTLNVSAADINELSKFTLEAVEGGWKIKFHADASDRTIVIPKYNSDGQPIVEIGVDAFSWDGVESVILPNSILRIDNKAFEWNSLTSIVIPDSVVYIGDSAFGRNGLASVKFNGQLPATLGLNVFQGNTPLVTGTVQVPTAQLSSYQSVWSTNLGLSSADVIKGY